MHIKPEDPIGTQNNNYKFLLLAKQNAICSIPTQIGKRTSTQRLLCHIHHKITKNTKKKKQNKTKRVSTKNPYITDQTLQNKSLKYLTKRKILIKRTNIIKNCKLNSFLSCINIAKRTGKKWKQNEFSFVAMFFYCYLLVYNVECCVSYLYLYICLVVSVRFDG